MSESQEKGTTLTVEKPLGVGRELDARVAKAMGWVDIRAYESTLGVAGYLGRSPDDFVIDVPWYSRDMTAAWRVVEKLADRFHAVVKSPFVAGELYHAGFTPLGTTGWNGRPDFAGSGETAPLAICRAALAALRVPADRTESHED